MVFYFGLVFKAKMSNYMQSPCRMCFLYDDPNLSFFAIFHFIFFNQIKCFFFF